MYVFFCKQKTAYEMRMSDWSSDVCSSDLSGGMIPTHGIERDGQGRSHPAVLNRLQCRPDGSGCSGLRHHFAAIIVTAGTAHMMRALQLATIRALDMGARLQGVMRTPHVTLRAGLLLLRKDRKSTRLNSSH